MAKQKVLVIDDEIPTLNMFQLFLRAYGYEALTAENGALGLEIFEDKCPSIVFTDIKMPGMDGIEVLDRIKGRRPETEVIIITGHGDMDLAVDALNHEATDFINKPIHRSALEAALHRAEERLKNDTSDAVIADSSQESEIGIIEIKGLVNAATEKTLTKVHEDFEKSKKGKLLIRFHDNASINGAGIGILIQLLSQANENQVKIAISGITKSFEQIFEMVGISRLARIFTDDQLAETYLNDE